MTVCIRCIVTGRVQGVFYRASTQRKAEALAISGYARNRPDGSVEVLACGAQSSVAQLQAWLWHGPACAKVADVRCEDVSDHSKPVGFEVM